MGARNVARPAAPHHDRTGAALSPAPALGAHDPDHGAVAPRYDRMAGAIAIGLSLYALSWVLFIIQPQVYRITFLLIALVLTFLCDPARRGRRAGTPVDWLLIAAALTALGWPLSDFQRFAYRAAEPGPLDLILGSVAVLLVLEAT